MSKQPGPRYKGEDLIRFRANCRVRRLLMGLSAGQLAKMTGHSTTWLTQMEVGPSKSIRYQDAEDVARALKTTVEILLRPAPDMVTEVTKEEGIYAIEYLKKLQAKMGLCGVDFSRYLGLGDSTWKITTRMMRPFSINSLYLIAQRLGVSVSELIGRTQKEAKA